MTMAVTIEQVMEYIKFWTDRNDEFSQTDQNIIAFVGPTKAGKSTLINCLMGKRLIAKENDASGKMSIAKTEKYDGGPDIGEEAESESHNPKCFGPFYQTDLLMCDFPGFGDNKGAKQEVANAISVKTVLGQQQSVRFILVVPFETIKGSDPFGFYQLLNSILNISPDIANHLILVASKIDHGNLKAVLNRLINTPFNNADSERLTIINKAKQMIQILLDNEACIEFKAPVGSQVNNLCIFQCADNLKKCVAKCQGVNVSNCNLVITNHAQIELVRLYDIIYNVLRGLINDIVENIRSKAMDEILILTNQTQRPNDVIEYGRKKIVEYRKIIVNNPNLQKLLTNVGTPDQRTMAIEFCKNFENLESLRNNCGHRLDGERELRLALINEINNAMVLVGDAVENIDPNARLLTQDEVREMANTERQHNQLVLQNLARITTSLRDFYENHRETINRFLAGLFEMGFRFLSQRLGTARLTGR